MDGMNHEPADDDDATRAFEALREEVAALRRGVELVCRQGQQSAAAAPDAPDYSPTLGKMEQALRAIAGRLEAVERQPALTLTPASFRAEIDAVARDVAGTVSLPFVDAVHQVQGTARDLTTLAGHVREQSEQRTWVLTAGALGLIVGVGLWYVAAGLLPRSAGDWIAASLIGGSRWQAGETLMQEASPEAWTRMVRLYNACGELATELCEAVITVRTLQPGQDGERAASARAPSHPWPRGRRVGEQGR
jgi:Family of unknown function (DUF6118)